MAAGPSNPMVAKLSSCKSGKNPNNAELMPEAFHALFNAELNTPSGVKTPKASGRCRRPQRFCLTDRWLHSKAVDCTWRCCRGGLFDREIVLTPRLEAKHESTTAQDCSFQRGIEEVHTDRFSFSWTQYNPQHPKLPRPKHTFFDKHQKNRSVKFSGVTPRQLFFWVNT